MKQPRCRQDSATPQDAERDVTPADVLHLAGKLLMPFTTEIQDGLAYSWSTPTAIRVLIQLKNGMESDVDVDRVTKCFRGWVNGIEIGDPEMN